MRPARTSGSGSGVTSEKSTGFSVGDRVALVPAYGTAQYALYGEVAIAPSRSLVAIPDHVGFYGGCRDLGRLWHGLGRADRCRSAQDRPDSAHPRRIEHVPPGSRVGGLQHRDPFFHDSPRQYARFDRRRRSRAPGLFVSDLFGNLRTPDIE
jgi:hypothetical protein